MTTKQDNKWQVGLYGFFNNVYPGLILSGMTVIASAIYTRFGSSWGKPVISGLTCGVIVFSLYSSWRAILSLPEASSRTTIENVGVKVLAWLHKFHLSVLSTADEEGDFSYIVTTEGGKRVTVRRSIRSFPDYITISGLVTLTGAEKDLVSKFSDEQAFRALFAIQKELLRANLGYNTTDVVNNGITLFKRIPITSSLAETEVMDAIWAIEAMIGTILLINALTRLEFESATRELVALPEKGEQTV